MNARFQCLCTSKFNGRCNKPRREHLQNLNHIATRKFTENSENPCLHFIEDSSIYFPYHKAQRELFDLSSLIWPETSPSSPSPSANIPFSSRCSVRRISSSSAFSVCVRDDSFIFFVKLSQPAGKLSTSRSHRV